MDGCGESRDACAQEALPHVKEGALVTCNTSATSVTLDSFPWRVFADVAVRLQGSARRRSAERKDGSGQEWRTLLEKGREHLEHSLQSLSSLSSSSAKSHLDNRPWLRRQEAFRTPPNPLEKLLQAPLILNALKSLNGVISDLQRIASHGPSPLLPLQSLISRSLHSLLLLPPPSQGPSLLHRLPFARIASGLAAPASSEASSAPSPAQRLGMSPEQVAKRLEGIPVYTVCNSNNEFVLVSDLRGTKSLALFCFREEDAATLLTQVRERDPSLGRGARVAPVSLDKVYLLAAEGIAFRFLPDPVQVKNAIKIVQGQSATSKQSKGEGSSGAAKRFYGVPVFQSENLILRSQNQRYIPAFFSKDDLELALQQATRQKKRVNPKLGASAAFQIQVGSLENALKSLEENDEDSVWGSLVFVPPGMDPQAHINKKA